MRRQGRSRSGRRQARATIGAAQLVRGRQPARDALTRLHGRGHSPVPNRGACRYTSCDVRSIVFALLILALPLAARAQEQLSVYNWSDYTVDSQLQAFERDTGIQVETATYDTNEILDAKLRMGGWGYDVVVPTASPFFASQLQAGLYRKLDRGKLRNWNNLDPAILAVLARYDPGNQHGVPFTWGTIGIGYNVAEVARRMPDAPVDSLRMIFDPAVLAKFKDCGVMLLDSATDVFPAALKYLGLDPDSKKPDDLVRAVEVLKAVRPFIRKFHS